MSNRIAHSSLTACATTLGLLLTVAIASADTRDPGAADALYLHAKEVAARGDYVAACREFAESLRLDPAPGTLLNLGDCQEHLGKLASASHYFSEAMQRLPSGDARIPYADGRMKRLASRIPHVTVTVTPAPAGTKVFCGKDEVVPSTLGIPQAVDPGEYVFAARAPSGAEQRVTVRIAEGESRSISLALPDSVDAPAAKPSPLVTPVTRDPVTETPASSPHSTNTAAWVVGGVGVVGFAVGATAGLMAMSNAKTFRDGCPGGDCVNQTSLDAGHRADSLGVVSTVAFGIGLVGIAALTYLLLTKHDTSSAAPVGHSFFRVAPVPTF